MTCSAGRRLFLGSPAWGRSESGCSRRFSIWSSTAGRSGQRCGKRRDAASLVKLLALADGHRRHREQVIDALWPDVSVVDRLEPFAQGGSLRAPDDRCVGQHRAHVRHGPPCSLATGSWSMRSSSSDRRSPDSPPATGSGSKGDPRCTGGELLPFDPYDDWAFHHRQRLQLRYRELFAAVAGSSSSSRSIPTDEDGHVGVMRGLLRAGDRRACCASSNC